MVKGGKTRKDNKQTERLEIELKLLTTLTTISAKVCLFFFWVVLEA